MLALVGVASVFSLANTASASAHPGQPALTLGSRGGPVAAWQRALNLWLSASGYEADRRLRHGLGGGLVVNGVFGVQTMRATKRFQGEVHRPSNGVVDLATWEAWIGANVTFHAGSIAALPPLRLGMENGYAGWWQVALDRWLQSHARPWLIVDTVFGPRTAEATAAFQTAVGLPATGRVDGKTWRALSRTPGGILFT